MIALAPGGKETISDAEFLRKFHATDGVALGLQLLRDAVDRRDPTDVEMALIVSSHFGFSSDHIEPLIVLAYADWHQQHENVAWALENMRPPEAVDALAHLARWVPSYLEFDNARALAVKAIWGLGKIGNEPARCELEALSHANSEVVARNARSQLDRSA